MYFDCPSSPPSACFQAASRFTSPSLRCTKASASCAPCGWRRPFFSGAIFLGGTALEWYHLIYVDGLTIRTNLFGTTFYSLVGLHATHVIVGLIMLALALIFSLRGLVTNKHAERLEVLSLYWHFVDGVWVVVFLVVYVFGR